MSSDAVGEIEKDDNVLVVRRIHVTYHLKAGEESRAAAERVLKFHRDYCATARTVRDSIEITTSLDLRQ